MLATLTRHIATLGEAVLSHLVYFQLGLTSFPGDRLYSRLHIQYEMLACEKFTNQTGPCKRDLMHCVLSLWELLLMECK